MQIVAVVDVSGSDFVLDRGKVGADLFAKLGLDGGVARKKINAPTRPFMLANVLRTIGEIDLRQRSGGGLVASD